MGIYLYVYMCVFSYRTFDGIVFHSRGKGMDEYQNGLEDALKGLNFFWTLFGKSDRQNSKK